MTFDTLKIKANRQPVHVVALDLDGCDLTFGTAPCTASAAAGAECYETFKTCQDQPNYDKVTKSLYFSDTVGDILRDATIPRIYPVLENISIAPTKITPNKGLGHRARVTLTLRDFPDHDRGTDPYVSTRSYIASDQGTFFGKLLARNPHYYARPMRVKIGYLDESGLDLAADFIEQTFLIEKIQGPDKSGKVKITGLDPLFLADGLKAQAPVQSEGELSAPITISATSLTLKTGQGAAYDASGEIRVNEEIITYASRAGDTFNTLTRGAWGTDAAEHDTDDGAQQCLVYQSAAVEAVVEDLMTTYAAIDASYIPSLDWADEGTEWLAAYSLTNIISEPTAVNELLAEIMEQTGTVIWWDGEAAEIKLKALVPRDPAAATPTLTDDVHFVDGKADVTDETDQRISQVWVHYSPSNYLEYSEDKNFRYALVRGDLTSEVSAAYAKPAIKRIYARWLSTGAQATQVASRLLSRFNDPPKNIKFQLDMKDSALKTGQHFYISSELIQGVDGAPVELEMQTLLSQYDYRSGILKYEALSFGFKEDRLARVAPSGSADYTAASAPDVARYAWACETVSEEMSNGDAPYTVF